MQSLRWDLFCRVVDNFGDIGVSWRLAADLGARGQRVRLWVDDASALRWMAPAGATGVELRTWPVAAVDVEPGDVVIEAFGCELPEHFVQRMARAAPAPVWINVEYLSAEDFVERSHQLSSPQTSGPGAGLRKWFFYPGFTSRTGGVIREQGLVARQRAFDASAWLDAQGVARRWHEQVVSLFCYEQTALPALLDQLAQQPTLLLATAGHAARQVATLLGPSLRAGELRAIELPALPQPEYDHLLWAADLNFVRGEDSFVRAQWAGKPFVWNVYPQHDDAHLRKLDAYFERFIERCIERFDAHLSGHFNAASDLRAFSHAWNAGRTELPSLPAAVPWRQCCEIWRDSLLTQPDLTHQLLGFVGERR